MRLSYFLWSSSPPDAELLELAAKNQLHQPEVLRQQVDRMIAHPRSDEFVAGFVSQWLDMERLDLFQFDIELYRDFDESTRAACRREVYESAAYTSRFDTGSSWETSQERLRVCERAARYLLRHRGCDRR